MKKHYAQHPYGRILTACGYWGLDFSLMNHRITRRKSKVTCKNCQKTIVFRKG